MIMPMMAGQSGLPEILACRRAGARRTRPENLQYRDCPYNHDGGGEPVWRCRSISPEINGRQAPCLPTGAHGPRSVLGYAGVSIIGLFIEKRFAQCLREKSLFFKELHREQGIVIFALSW